MKLLLSAVFVGLQLVCLYGQKGLTKPLVDTTSLTGMVTRWNDSFTEWDMFTTEKDTRGELRLSAVAQDDWSRWQYRIGEGVGTLRLKWPGNPNEWEARGDNAIATARTIFRDNFQEWRVTDGTHTVTLRTRYQNLSEDWALRSDRHGWFEMYTAYEGDLRDWIIVDELSDDVPLPMRVLLSFLVVYHSTPKL
ncbi:MAG: hypothetical protein KI786_10905 [Mameliella sp.]|nr:hypothetical protein [Phaeodactylibacter sp.]NRA50531.1 hypothetical protein [Phaeodactylibacter sp.]